MQVKAKKYDEAEAAYKKAIELKPDFAEAYNGLANVYNAQKKFDRRPKASKKAMELATRRRAGGARRARRRGGRAQRVADLQPGRHPLERRARFPRRRRQFEAGGQGRPEHRRRALPGSAWRYVNPGERRRP